MKVFRREQPPWRVLGSWAVGQGGLRACGVGSCPHSSQRAPSLQESRAAPALAAAPSQRPSARGWRERPPGRFTGPARHKALLAADSAPCLPGATARSALHPRLSAQEAGTRLLRHGAAAGAPPQPLTGEAGAQVTRGLCPCDEWERVGVKPGAAGSGRRGASWGCSSGRSEEPGPREHPLCGQPGQTDAYNHYFLTYWWVEINIL